MNSLFKDIDQLLLSQQSLWRFEPFMQARSEHQPSDKQPEVPEPLLALVNALDFDQVERLKQDTPALVGLLAPLIDGLSAIHSRITLERMQEHSSTLARGIEQGIPGRKLTQIVAMSQLALDKHKGDQWLEWCAGKGYLGRILAHETGEVVTSFEYQQALCESGQEIADSLSLPMQFVQGDAFNLDSEKIFSSDQHAVALHACGDLHVELMKYGSMHALSAMSISPCCYHLIQSDAYQALSNEGRASSLALNKKELRIPLQKTVTGGQRVHRHRQLEMSYRLGLDKILCDQLGSSEYVPIPSVKKSQLSEGFEAFCRWALDAKSIKLDGMIDYNAYQAIGEERFEKMERLSLIQQVFQRPLEMWLVLDKSLYLKEQGYTVELMEFCSEEVTPRNILIHASR